MTRFVVIFIFGAIVFYGCEEIDDPALEGRPPTIRIDFDPREAKESTKSFFDSLNIIVRTLNAELDTFRTGDRNPEDSMAFYLELQQIEPVYDSIDQVNKLFQKSEVRIDSLLALGGNYVEEHQDTVKSIVILPLNINADSSAFVFHFHNFADTITFRYRTEVSSGIERINITARNVSATNTNSNIELFRFSCIEENCTSGEITYKIYF